MFKKKHLLFLLLSLLALVLAACGGGTEAGYLAAGDQAPDFTLPDMQGGDFVLSNHLGDQPVLLYFSMADG